MKFSFFTLLALGFCVMLAPGCRPSVSKADIAQVDTLILWAEMADEILDFNDKAIAMRADTVKMRYDFITNNYTHLRGTVPHEVQMLMTKYRGMQRSYGNFGKNYPVLLFDNAKHRERLATLRNDLIAGHIKPVDFEDYIRTERPIIAEHLQRTRTLATSITGIEPDYYRVRRQVNELYQDMERECKRKGGCTGLTAAAEEDL